MIDITELTSTQIDILIEVMEREGYIIKDGPDVQMTGKGLVHLSELLANDYENSLNGGVDGIRYRPKPGKDHEALLWYTQARLGKDPDEQAVNGMAFVLVDMAKKAGFLK